MAVGWWGRVLVVLKAVMVEGSFSSFGTSSFCMQCLHRFCRWLRRGTVSAADMFGRLKGLFSGPQVPGPSGGSPAPAPQQVRAGNQFQWLSFLCFLQLFSGASYSSCSRDWDQTHTATMLLACITAMFHSISIFSGLFSSEQLFMSDAQFCCQESEWLLPRRRIF